MPTRITKFRQRNVIGSTALALPTLQAGEIARVIPNYLQVKITENGESLSWKNLWAHLFLVPSGYSAIPVSWPEPQASLVPVASLTIQTVATSSVTFRIPHTLTLRGGPNSTGFDTTGSINSKYLVDSDADFLIGGGGDLIRNRTIFTGSGHVTGSVSGSQGVFLRWNVPEHFYMSPGDSLMMQVGGYVSTEWRDDTQSTYFLGTDIDLVYVIDSN
jgi:hypothetical protein